jgi:hypothetical protein
MRKFVENFRSFSKTQQQKQAQELDTEVIGNATMC